MVENFDDEKEEMFEEDGKLQRNMTWKKVRKMRMTMSSS